MSPQANDPAKMSRTTIRIFALKDAIEYEKHFLDSMSGCHAPEDEDARKFAQGLLRAYRLELDRWLKGGRL